MTSQLVSWLVLVLGAGAGCCTALHRNPTPRPTALLPALALAPTVEQGTNVTRVAIEHSQEEAADAARACTAAVAVAGGREGGRVRCGGSHTTPHHSICGCGEHRLRQRGTGSAARCRPQSTVGYTAVWRAVVRTCGQGCVDGYLCGGLHAAIDALGGSRVEAIPAQEGGERQERGSSGGRAPSGMAGGAAEHPLASQSTQITGHTPPLHSAALETYRAAVH